MKFKLILLLTLLVGASATGLVVALPLIAPSVIQTRTSVQPTPASILLSLKEQAQLTTYTMSFQTPISMSSVNTLLNVPIGTAEATLLATGTVDAGIDLDQLTQSDITIQDDSIAVRLPSSTIQRVSLDPGSELVKSEAVLIASTKGMDGALRKQAIQQFKQTACASNIINQANIKAAKVIQKLLSSTTGKNVIVEFKPGNSCLS